MFLPVKIKTHDYGELCAQTTLSPDLKAPYSRVRSRPLMDEDAGSRRHLHIAPFQTVVVEARLILKYGKRLTLGP